MKAYYNGYKVQGSGDSIYSTWSVMNYLQTEDLKDYWIDNIVLQNISTLLLQREIWRLVSELLVGKKNRNN